MKPKFKRIEIPGEREIQYPKGYMYFVYAPEGSFLLTGQNSDNIKEYIDSHFPICIYRWSCWQNGKSRGMWQAKHPNLYVFITSRREVKERSAEYVYRKKTNKMTVEFIQKGISNPKIVTFTCRRMPNRWIPEWDDAIKQVLQ